MERSGHGCLGWRHSLNGISSVKPPAVARNTAQVPKLEEEGITEPYKITRPGAPLKGAHIGRLLAKKLNTHPWHVLRIQFVDEPQLETYESVVAAKTVTPKAIKKLLAKSWCARQIMWPNRQNGILVETGANGFHLVAPGGEQAVIHKADPRVPGVRSDRRARAMPVREPVAVALLCGCRALR
jgi:hypothetical protein